jgi:hypothetical protein
MSFILGTDFAYERKHNICLPEPDLFHLTCWFPNTSPFLETTWFHSLRLNNTRCVCVLHFLYLLIGWWHLGWFHSLVTANKHRYAGCTLTYIPSDIYTCPGVVQEDYMKVLLLVFCGTFLLASIVTASVYIPSIPWSLAAVVVCFLELLAVSNRQ